MTAPRVTGKTEAKCRCDVGTLVVCVCHGANNMYLSQQEASWWENMRPVVICCGRVLSVTWGETSPGTSEEGMTQRRAPTPIKQATGKERQTAIYALLLLCIAQPCCTLSGVWFAPIPRSKFPGNAPGLTAFGLWDSTLDVIDQRHSEWAHTHSLFGADATGFFCFFRFIGSRATDKNVLARTRK